MLISLLSSTESSPVHREVLASLTTTVPTTTEDTNQVVTEELNSDLKTTTEEHDYIDISALLAHRIVFVPKICPKGESLDKRNNCRRILNQN